MILDHFTLTKWSLKSQTQTLALLNVDRIIIK